MKKLLTAMLICLLLPTTALGASNTPPDLENVTVYASVVPPEGTVVVGADIWDSDGVEMNLLRFESTDGHRLELSLEYTAGYGTAAERYSGRLKIPADTPEGVYTLVFASVTDRQMNRARYYPPNHPDCTGANDFWLGGQPQFTVKKGVPDPGKEDNERKTYNDSTPPTLGSVSLAFTERVSNGTRYELHVAATDAQGNSDSESSGIGHITLRFKNNRNGRVVSKVLSANDMAGKIYSGQLTINSYEPSGSFVLYGVTVTDRAFNSSSYALPADIGKGDKLPLAIALSLAVDNGSVTADTTAPTLHMVSPARDELTVGETLYITASAKDDLSGVQSVSLQFRNDEGKTVALLLTDKGGGTMGGTLQSFQTGKAGRYRLTQATVTDRAGNRSSGYENPVGGLDELNIAASFTIKERS